VLDAFDEWRRAVGVGMAGGAPETGASAPPETPATPAGEGSEAAAPPSRPSHSLRAHLDRTVIRLTDLQARGGLATGLDAVVERAIASLAGGRDASRTLRGEGREEYLRALERLDAEVLDAARQATPPGILEGFRLEAGDELAAYRDRMAPAAFERAAGAAADRLLRDHWKLPIIAYRG
jgi:hypothetical protein